MSGVPFQPHQAVKESFFGIAHCVLVYFQQGSIDSTLTSHYWEGKKNPRLVCLFSHSSFQWSLKSLLAQGRWSIFSLTPLPLHLQNQTLVTITSFLFFPPEFLSTYLHLSPGSTHSSFPPFFPSGSPSSSDQSDGAASRVYLYQWHTADA